MGDVHCVYCVVRRTSELAGRAPFIAFCANWELTSLQGRFFCWGHTEECG